MTPFEKIETIAIVMMENRSFDHILGHLGLRGSGYVRQREIDGISMYRNPDYANPFDGEVYYPYRDDGGPLFADLPHEREFVKTQIAEDVVGGWATMTGFVQAYYDLNRVVRVAKPPPMAILGSDAVPISDFLARSFTVCNRWFAPLPASTHPNRLVALSGYSRRDRTPSSLLPRQPLLLDWLKEREISWRVYSAGLPFFFLFEHLWDDIFLGDHFRPLSHLKADITSKTEPFPKVILIEPDYTDSPVHTSGHASDDHPPTAIGFGEVFLRDVYQALTLEPSIWKGTVAIFTYDEHGGFFDHVPPLSLRTDPPADAEPRYVDGFRTTGIRVPSLIVSPFVDPASLCSPHFDHTSILQFLAERFDPRGSGYSSEVNRRRDSEAAIQSISVALTRDEAREHVPEVPLDPIPIKANATPIRVERSASQLSFEEAACRVVEKYDRETVKRTHPELLGWYAERSRAMPRP